MVPALAIFVKTPGLSPVKTRLAAVIGVDHAIRFHTLAAMATADVVRSCEPDLVPYWAVAEASEEIGVAWPGFAQVAQGDGDLGARLHHVYGALQRRHGGVLLIGADTPQLTPELLRHAVETLNDNKYPFVLGPAIDGGFWLFGGRQPVSLSVWNAVQYSGSGTAGELRDALEAHGAIATLPELRDVDDVEDMRSLAESLRALRDPLPAQRELAAWVCGVDERPSPVAGSV